MDSIRNQSEVFIKSNACPSYFLFSMYLEGQNTKGIIVTRNQNTLLGAMQMPGTLYTALVNSSFQQLIWDLIFCPKILTLRTYLPQTSHINKKKSRDKKNLMMASSRNLALAELIHQGKGRQRRWMCRQKGREKRDRGDGCL